MSEKVLELISANLRRTCSKNRNFKAENHEYVENISRILTGYFHENSMMPQTEAPRKRVFGYKSALSRPTDTRSGGNNSTRFPELFKPSTNLRNNNLFRF